MSLWLRLRYVTRVLAPSGDRPTGHTREEEGTFPLWVEHPGEFRADVTLEATFAVGGETTGKFT